MTAAAGPVLVTGASGVLGRHLLAGLAAAGHQVRALRHRAPLPELAGVEVVRGDLVSGEGLEQALAGVAVVVHCAGDRRRHRAVDRGGTRRLMGMLPAGVHVVLPSLVGCDLIPLSHTRSRQLAEEAVTARGPRFSIVRFTDFPQRLWAWAERLARWPVLPVPADTRFQPLQPEVAARRLLQAVEAGPSGRVDELGGPLVHWARDIAASFLAATGRSRPVVAVNYPGISGAALRAGANLTPHRAEGSPTWNDFVRSRLAVAAEPAG